MKTKAALSFLSLSLMGIAIISQAHAADSKESTRAHSEAVESCTELSNATINDLGAWGEARGITETQLRQFVDSLCLGGLPAAREAKNEDELDMYWLVLRQKLSGSIADELYTPVSSSQSISTKYFRALNGTKNKNVTH
ncbi:hypothetical protein D8682_01520 [Buttiauxella sp. 3AFRM03]|uniref:hypothetical protein n=1 Tax=Buttiauxella sp. 3AFRM03 TaxID=2479367 RepID=UPI000EF82F2A|nr:hypothetical protein [Buttiauxella sp. 3AFRM03]AYN25776.1 hypothetical protein D8682_01520 [Buttiauxella sp. 3AFRM03]